MISVLPDFQKMLIEKKSAPAANVKYYALWVSKFLSFSNGHPEKNLEMRTRLFLDFLATDQKLQDWQVEQAAIAIKLYISYFPSRDVSALSPDKTEQRGMPDYQTIKDKLRESIRIKHYAYSTERTYTEWFERFYSYVTKEKKKDWLQHGVDKTDARDFLSYLALRQRVSSSTQNQAFNALLFLYRQVLNVDLQDLSDAVRAKRGPKLPAVLTEDEVFQVFKQLGGKDLLIAQLLYGTGMRLMELARLRVQDIDFAMNSITIRAGKGDKDRVTVLPKLVITGLKDQLAFVNSLHQQDLEKGFGEVYLPEALERKYPQAAKEPGWQYVFPASALSVDPRSGKVRRHHISPSAIQKAVTGAARKSGIVKNASVHTLRHSFATHLLMSGVNIREVQELLGHKNVETTMIYTHVLRNMSKAPLSPLDTLYESIARNPEKERPGL